MKIKKWNSSTSQWEQDYPEVDISSIVATGTPSSSNFLRGDGTWSNEISTIDMGTTGVINFNKTTGTVSKIVGANNGIDFYSDDPIRFIESDASTAAVTMSLNTGTVTATTFSGALSGNASTSTKLATARNIAIDGSVTGNANFDGSANITITTTTNHGHGNITSAGAIGSTAGLMVKTTTSGVLTTLAAGTAGQFLQYDGTWATPSGGGSVTEAAIEAALTNVSFGDSTIEFNGTPLGNNGGTLNYDGDPVYHAGNNNIGTGSSNYAAGNHSHYNLNSDGTWASSPATIANGDRLVIVDSSSSNKINHATLTFGTGTTTFLANNGTWQTPSGGGGGATVLYDDDKTGLTVFQTSWSTPTGTPQLSLSANKKYYLKVMIEHQCDTLGVGLGLSPYFSNITTVDVLGGTIRVMDSGSLTGITSEDSAPWNVVSTSPGSSGEYVLTTSGAGTTATYAEIDAMIDVGATATTLYLGFRVEAAATITLNSIAMYALEVA